MGDPALNYINFTDRNATLTYGMDHTVDMGRMNEMIEQAEIRYKTDVLAHYLHGIAGVSICGTGIICNILSVVVLSRKPLRSSTYSYLSALALCDTLVLFFTLLLLTKDTKRPAREIRWDEPYYAEMFPIVHPMAVTAQIASIWLTLAFTVDRYIMICHPFKAEKYCSISRARKVIFGLCLAAVLFNIPKFFEYKTTDVPLPTNETRLVFELTAVGNSKLFREIVHSWLYLICVCGVPFIALAVLNAFLIHAVHMSHLKGKEMNPREVRRNDTTVMLIGIVVIFLICQFPALISRIMWAVDKDRFLSSWPSSVLNEVGNFLILLNSAINILPYYFFGKKFRQEFWILLCPCCLNIEEQRMLRSCSMSFDGNRKMSVMSNNAVHMDEPPPYTSGMFVESGSQNATPLIENSADTSEMSALCKDPENGFPVNGHCNGIVYPVNICVEQNGNQKVSCNKCSSRSAL